jgi:hypothetical protein
VARSGGGQPFFRRFDREFQATFHDHSGIVNPPMSEGIALIGERRKIFVCPTDSVYNFAEMKGFAALCSVLEAQESVRAKQNQAGPFVRSAKTCSSTWQQFSAHAGSTRSPKCSLSADLSYSKKNRPRPTDDSDLGKLTSASFEFSITSLLPAVLGRS